MLGTELVDELAEVGARFTHHSSIAPTGTISLSLANNASNGIEPSFAHHYSRNVIREGKKSKEKVDVWSYELLAYRELVNAAAMPYGDNSAAMLKAAKRRVNGTANVDLRRGDLEPLPIEDGWLTVPTGPGLGVEVDDQTIRRLRI